MTYVKSGPHPPVVPRRRSRTPLVIAAVVVVALVAAVGGPAVAMAGELPRNTYVAGIDIGGLDPADARAKLTTALADRAVRPIAVTTGEKTVPVTPQQAGLAFDVPATVADAHGGVVTSLGSLFGRRDIPLRLTVDEALLTTAVAGIAEGVDRPAKQGGILYQGTTPRVAAPADGRVIDRNVTATRLRQAYLEGAEAVTVELGTVQPRVTADEMRRFADATAAGAIEPITLTNGDRSAELSTEVVAANLRFLPDGTGKLRAQFNARKALVGVEDRLVDAAKAPKDASFEIVKGKPVVVPSETGQGVDAEALKTSVEETVAGGGNRTVEVSFTTSEPALTTAKAEALGIKEKVSTFTTQHPCCAPRVTNIHTIADILDNHLVMPGETFSLNGTVGKRDTARGFVSAPMISAGRFVNDVGGGISQFVTTMFNAVFFGGFEDVQHMAHQYYISRYPAGRESTVSFPQPDFRWKNDSKYGVLVTTSYTSTSVTVTFWSTKRWDVEAESSGAYDTRTAAPITDSGPDCLPMGGAQGFSIDVTRVFKKDGKEVRRQKFHTVYDAEPVLTCEG
ncbi:VanW family protein [Herbidospora mongoliensis]|uniref:VanW family protein n=1 Tax=Herbidospora mongoliensis TaxID=688067 RepID=UPI00082CADCE|nr:VanW family protein [Herbidospora mongoliensis]